MRQSRRCLLLGVLTILSTSGQAYMPDAEDFDAPSLSVRGALKAAIKHDYEDVVVMQTEMAWGAKEMNRYKSIKGEWPVRSSIDDKDTNDDEDEAASGDASFLRGKEAPIDPEDEDTDYWSYLVSIF